MEQIILPILVGAALRTVWAMVSIMTQDVPKGWLYGITERRVRLIQEIKTAALVGAAIILYHFAFSGKTEAMSYNVSLSGNSYGSYSYGNY